MDRPEAVGGLTDLLLRGGYVADRGLSTALFVALSLGRPILLEGEVGVGKTEVAKVLADPGIKARADAAGLFPATTTPAEFAAFIAKEAERWSKVVKETGIRYD